MSLDFLAQHPVIKNLGFAVGFMEISLSVIELQHFEKKCAINKFLALVKKVHFSAFLNFSENCPTLLGCGVQTT